MTGRRCSFTKLPSSVHVSLHIMNKILVFLFVLAATVASAPTDRPIAILNQEQDISPDGSFVAKFETENGISEQIQGSVKQIDEDTQVQVIQGVASWTAPDGTPVRFSWIADENGYQPQGDLLPTPPAIPADIQRGLQYISEHPQPTDSAVQQ